MVHIVQTSKKTISYGANQPDGNVYYEWPMWIPMLGCQVMKLPVSNFELKVEGYPAYDKDRAEFTVDVVAFFRIKDTNLAAARVSGFEHLRKQLVEIIQGAVRKILAQHDIHTIMVERATFGEQFTEEVRQGLEAWGVEPVKSLELMQIRDAAGSTILQNIMAMKASEIEMTSRLAVAENTRKAEEAEIVARQAVDVRRAEAE